MTNKQENYHSMTEAAMGVMDKNNSLWNLNPLISAIVGLIKGTITSINTAAGIQQQAATGATKSEHALWVTAANLTEHVCFGLKAYYMNTNDMVTFDIVNFTISDFTECTKLKAVDRMQLIHDNAAAIPIGTLTNYNIVATDITGLQTAINNFSASQPLHTIMKAGTKTATGNLAPLFKTQRHQMKLLDMYMGTMKTAHADFYSTFHNARKIINLGKGQMAEELHLMPKNYEAIFGKKFETGDTFTVRNHSKYAAEVYLSDITTALPTANGVKIAAETDLQLEVGKDFGSVFGHWLLVDNPNALDDVHVTVILAHGKSHSSAVVVGNVTA